MASGRDKAGSSQLHLALREATKEAHHRLDHHTLLAPLLSSTLTREQYQHCLAAFLPIYQAFETAILGFNARYEGGFDYVSARRTARIASDLEYLAHPPLHANIQIEPPRSLSALIGLLYVIEGSSLGGQAIARFLREHTKLNIPLQFFDGDGDGTYSRWQCYLAFANANCPASQHEEAITSAVNAFLQFRRWLDQYAGTSI